MDRDNGGQAFPCKKEDVSKGSYCVGVKINPGMTMRDYFMAHAPEMPEWFKEWRNHFTLEQAYFDWRIYYADAMLLERKKC